MRSKEEIQAAVAEALRDLRRSTGLSKAKMADSLYIDRATWRRYESGETSPSIADFIYFYALHKRNALQSVLEFVYPSTYKKGRGDGFIDDIRNAAVHYFGLVASNQTIRAWQYLVTGDHGSNIEAQMQLFIMLDQLPLRFRYVIAAEVYEMWTLCRDSGILLNADAIKPDEEVFRRGFERGRDAAAQGKDSYTTIM